MRRVDGVEGVALPEGVQKAWDSRRDASGRRAAMRRWLSEAWAYAHDNAGRPLDGGQPELLKVNDERAASQARPTYPGGRGDLPESRMSPRPYSEITGATKLCPGRSMH